MILEHVTYRVGVNSGIGIDLIPKNNSNSSVAIVIEIDFLVQKIIGIRIGN